MIFDVSLIKIHQECAKIYDKYVVENDIKNKKLNFPDCGEFNHPQLYIDTLFLYHFGFMPSQQPIC